MGKVIAVSNQKGGVAKTTTSINLGVALARNGKRVLLVDADPQGHLSTGLGISKTTKVTLKTMMEYVIMEMEYDPYEAVIKNDEGVDIIPSNKLLSGTDISLITVEERESILKKYLDTLKTEYDYVVIDCMPSLGMLTVNAMAAADSVLIPIEPEYYALDGMVELLRVIRNIKKRYNPRIEIEGILSSVVVVIHHTCNVAGYESVFGFVKFHDGFHEMPCFKPPKVIAHESVCLGTMLMHTPFREQSHYIEVAKHSESGGAPLRIKCEVAAAISGVACPQRQLAGM